MHLQDELAIDTPIGSDPGLATSQVTGEPYFLLLSIDAREYCSWSISMRSEHAEFRLINRAISIPFDQ
jgi:hypothetical protein